MSMSIRPKFLRYLQCLIGAIGLFVLATQASAASLVNELLHNPGSPVGGNPHGRVTLVEFFDYQCSHCIDMAPTIANLIQHNPNLRVVFKDFPIRGPLSTLGARAALAANNQGRYYALSHAMLTTDLPLSQDTIMAMAKTAGLSIPKLQKEMQSQRVKNEIKDNYQLAQALRIPGTPVFYIGKTNASTMSQLTYIPGSVSESQLQSAINAASH